MYWHMYWRYKSVFPISSKVQSKVATPGNVRSAVGITNNYYLRTQTNSKYGLGNSDHWIKKNQILTSTSAINNLYNVIYVNVMCNDMFCKIVFHLMWKTGNCVYGQRFTIVKSTTNAVVMYKRDVVFWGTFQS